MLKRLTAALLVTCMLFCMPAFVSMADSANPEISEAETAKPEETILPEELPEADQNAASASDAAKTDTPEETNEPEETDGLEEQVPGDSASEPEETPDTMVQELEETPETVVFTDAGPFRAPVSVANGAGMGRAAAKEDDDTDGLVLAKTATEDGNGYKIRLEAYTTGTVTITTSAKPVDIVLVLDQSGSMAYDFNGKRTSINTNRRQYAMKQAVDNFIAEVNGKYNAETGDHRIALVTFGNDASILQKLTFVDDAGKTILQREINDLADEPSGATNVAAGMGRAETLMGAGYSYEGSNTVRQKVVIVFTDGVPTQRTAFDTVVADNAIAAAKNLKDSGTTIYSVGIFNGANPNELWGKEYTRVGTSIPCNGNVGEYWGHSLMSPDHSNDFNNLDVPAGNRFLNYASSNYDARSIGISYNNWEVPPGRPITDMGYFWIIDEPAADGKNNGYYLTAADADSLNEIFTMISEQIQTENIDLGSGTIIDDIIAPYFNMPADASDIKVMTADYNGVSGIFGPDEASELTAVIDTERNAVSVTGFDFNSNFVSDTLKTDGTYGKKLIVEFTVAPKSGFLGGNQVPTNGEESGVYDKDGKPVKDFEQPKVDVPIKEVSVSAADKNVYLLASMSDADLRDGAEIMIGNIPLSPSKENYGLEAWQNAFVTIAVTASPASGYTGLTEDKKYTISCSISPKTGGEETPKTETDTGKINVYKPEVTFKDSVVFYGDAALDNPDYYNTNNYVETVWKHGETDASEVTMTGAAPELIFDYIMSENTFADGKIAVKNDISVNAATRIGNSDVTAHTQYAHEDCDPACGFDKEREEFLLHVRTCGLTIEKKGGEDGENFIFNIKKDGSLYTTVLIPADSSVTIKELPVGSYTVSEDVSWTWRYEPTYTPGQEAVLTLGNPEAAITCTNKKVNNEWLTWSGNVKNEYGIPNDSSAKGGGN